MRWRDPRVWLTALATLGVLAIAAADLQRTQPGPLSAAHAQVAELDLGARCSACHGGWFSDLQQACSRCHEEVAAQFAAGRGLHGRLGRERAANCGLCHGEHHGGEFELVNRASWAMAGVPDATVFDHALVGRPLDGKHLQLPCARCHAHADDRPLAAGALRFLGLDGDCQACHEDRHAGAMQARCDQCHAQSAWADQESVGHDRVLALTGGHAGLACARCHEPASRHALDALGRLPTAARAAAARACSDCHESPHRAGLVVTATLAAPRPAGESLARGTECAACHRPEQATFADARNTMTPGLHAAAGFALVAPHADLACTGCHAAVGTFAERHPVRAAENCAACHADPHGGQFEHSELARAGCRSCHAREQFAPHAFTVALHERTSLPLVGRHAEIVCDACHEKADARTPRRFVGVPARCEQCHRDVHGDAFAARRTELARGAAGECAVCHDTVSFAAADRGFDHAHFTPLALAGAHAQVQCAACHAPRAAPDDAGRSFGRVADAHGRYRGCATCHEDPHAGRFDRAGMPAVVAGRTDCARCHGDVSFRTVADDFDHGLWTGFALDGAHRSARCDACHPAGDPTGRTTVPPARGTRCADCHDEPHAGQFAQHDATDCRRCHRAATTFHDLAFRHDVDARFALGEAHANVPCAACHKAEAIAGHAVVRYRPVPRECTDCHDQIQDPLRRQARTNRGGTR